MYGVPASGAQQVRGLTATPATLTQLGSAGQGSKLVGAEGSEYVANLLRTSKTPQLAIAQVQATCGLSHPLCQPLLQMLDYLNISRKEAHEYILNRARGLLVAWLKSVQASAQQRNSEHGADEPESKEELEMQEKLERLLIASFKYMGVPELAEVPIEVMKAMSRVPAPFLKQLAEEREFLKGLPPQVKQQVYEYDRNLLHHDAVQYIAAYKYELGTIMAAINMTFYMRTRPRICSSSSNKRQQQLFSGSTGAGSGAPLGGPLLPKPGRGLGPGSGGGRGPPGAGCGRVGGFAGGFSVQSVLNAVASAAGEQVKELQQQPPQQVQRTPLRTPPRSPSAADGGPLALLSGQLGSGSSKSPVLASRRTVRSGSEAIKMLREMVGNSGKIYGNLVELCEVRLKETASPYLGVKEWSYCALRTQLLMSLHDNVQKPSGGNKMASTAPPARREKDFLTRVREQSKNEARSHELVWVLDAALAQRRLTVAYMKKLGEVFENYIKVPARWLEEEEEEGPSAGGAAAAAAATARASSSSRARSSAPTAAIGGKRPVAAKALGAAAGAGPAKRRKKAGPAASEGGGRRRGGGGGFEEVVYSDTEDVLLDDDFEDDPTLGGFIEQDDGSAPGDGLDAEDVCGANEARQQDRWLADAGMILRDPPAMHLLAAEVVEVMYKCLKKSRLPADEPQLVWLLRLMQLGINARGILRENAFAMPPVPTKLLQTVWAELMNVLAEGEVMQQPWQEDVADADMEALSPGWNLLVQEYSRQEVLRQVVQALVLDRLLNGDLITAHRLLQLIVESRHVFTAAAVPEYAPFAFSLATTMLDLVNAGSLSAGTSFWRLAVDEVLMQLVDAEGQVHVELLRLLAAAAKAVQPETLVGYLDDMLTATKVSRERAASQKRKFADITAHFGGGKVDDSDIPSYINAGGGASEWSDGFRYVRKAKYGRSSTYGNSDALSSLYEKVITVGGLRDKQHLWPDSLRTFIQEAEQRRQQEEEARRAERRAQEEAQRLALAEDGLEGSQPLGSQP